MATNAHISANLAEAVSRIQALSRRNPAFKEIIGQVYVAGLIRKICCSYEVCSGSLRLESSDLCITSCILTNISVSMRNRPQFEDAESRDDGERLGALVKDINKWVMFEPQPSSSQKPKWQLNIPLFEYRGMCRNLVDLSSDYGLPIPLYVQMHAIVD